MGLELFVLGYFAVCGRRPLDAARGCDARRWAGVRQKSLSRPISIMRFEGDAVKTASGCIFEKLFPGGHGKTFPKISTGRYAHLDSSRLRIMGEVCGKRLFF